MSIVCRACEYLKVTVLQHVFVDPFIRGNQRGNGGSCRLVVYLETIEGGTYHACAEYFYQSYAFHNRLKELPHRLTLRV